jgi:predicted transcriptional regulator
MVYGPTTMDEEKHSATSVMKAMSDNKSLQLFKIIATATLEIPSADCSGSINTQTLISKVNLTRKQYYSRISNLISAGLIRRSNGKYIR